MANVSISLSKALDEFLASPQSRAGMKVELAGFKSQCGADCPIFLAAGEVRPFMKEAKKAGDRKKRAETMEAFFDFARGKGWISSNPAAGLIKKKEPRVEKKKPAPAKSEPVLLSAKGRQRIEAEIEGLLIEKTKVIEEVAAAREEGDLSENAGYHDARERLGLIEWQIREKEDILARAVIVE